VTTSLRARLFAVLVIATGALWMMGALWINFGARSQVEHVLDNRLQDAAHMIASLISSGRLPVDALNQSSRPTRPSGGSYLHQLSCQIWSFDDRLVARSGGAPEATLSASGVGFSEREINGEIWRVFALEDRERGFRLLVGDRLSLREGLVSELIKGLLWPAAFILPLLGSAIWASVGSGLRPLKRIAEDISARDGEDMRALRPSHAPEEIRPLIAAINGLFSKVEAARRHEQEITAFAAHELRTPLAGLKTQAQIASRTVDDEVRQKALEQILRSVDRTARLVSQLLALARLEASASFPIENVQIGDALDEAVELSRAAGPGVFVRIDPDLRDACALVPKEALALVLRNLTENALEHSPPCGTIHWRLTDPAPSLELCDEGAGVADAELPFLTRRFFRSASQTKPGSGLGLAIAEVAAAHCGARLELVNRSGRSGFAARLIFDLGNDKSRLLRST
jgi:two-component system sensor histidine kinase QseC